MSDGLKLFVNCYMAALMLLPFAAGIYLKKKNKLDSKMICMLILMSGFLLRLIYITYTSCDVRQNDMGVFGSDVNTKMTENHDHSGYIMYIVENAKLPDFDPRGHWQFYHPPLHHVICACILGVIKLFGVDYHPIAAGVLQVLSVAYNMALCFLAYKTLEGIGLDGKPLELSLAGVTFFPAMIILSGSMNNDTLSSTLGMAAIYSTVRWVNDEKTKSIIMIALSVGFGMMTKLTVGLLAPAVAAVFLTVLIKRKKDWKKLFGQFAVFAVICLPLGLAWPVRQWIKFRVPPTYIPTEQIRPEHELISVTSIRRFFDFSLYQFKSPFMQRTDFGDPYTEFNPFIGLIKTAMFGDDRDFTTVLPIKILCMALFISGCVTAVIAAAALIMMWSKKDKTRLEFKLLITLVFAVVIGNYLVFCVNFPYACTMNIRYAIPAVFCGAAALGLLFARGENNEKPAVKTAAISVTSMCALSVFVYTAMMF